LSFDASTINLDDNKIAALQIGAIIEKIEDKALKIIN